MKNNHIASSQNKKIESQNLISKKEEKNVFSNKINSFQKNALIVTRSSSLSLLNNINSTLDAFFNKILIDIKTNKIGNINNYLKEIIEMKENDLIKKIEKIDKILNQKNYFELNLEKSSSLEEKKNKKIETSFDKKLEINNYDSDEFENLNKSKYQEKFNSMINQKKAKSVKKSQDLKALTPEKSNSSSVKKLKYFNVKNEVKNLQKPLMKKTKLIHTISHTKKKRKFEIKTELKKISKSRSINHIKNNKNRKNSLKKIQEEKILEKNGFLSLNDSLNVLISSNNIPHESLENRNENKINFSLEKNKKKANFNIKLKKTSLRSLKKNSISESKKRLDIPSKVADQNENIFKTEQEGIFGNKKKAKSKAIRNINYTQTNTLFLPCKKISPSIFGNEGKIYSMKFN